MEIYETVKYCIDFILGVYNSEVAVSSHTISKNVTLSESGKIYIKSPGSPFQNYKKNTIYIWTVTAPETTNEILIIMKDLDISYIPGHPCEDSIKVFISL